MQAVDIRRSKFKQCFYNDKHQDPLVLQDRMEYVKVMDELMLRLPLWLQLPVNEISMMRDRLPTDGLLVHYFEVAGDEMVEVHVDLDDSFDSMRAALPLGGAFSVRFPGSRPSDTALTSPPSVGLAEPGEEMAADDSAPRLNSADHNVAAPPEAAAAQPPAAQPPALTIAEVNKMNVFNLKKELNARGLSMQGLKAELLARLLAALPAPAPTEESDDEGDEEWKVKKIIGRRVVTNVIDDLSYDVVEYQVQWDWPEEDDPTQDEITWEVEGNLSHCTEALHEFLACQPKEAGCRFGHMQGVCRCAMPLIHAGQDESIFKAYQKSAFQWVVRGVRGLRKKTDGPGEMVSGFKDELRGFGHPLTPAELVTLNAFRKARGRPPLTTSPCVRFLSYGKNKDGYWNYDQFADQVTDVLDLYESLYPSAQVLVEVDWSSGHSKHRVDALNVTAMSVNYGGKQPIPHPSQMVEGCLGEGATLKEGDLQYFYFRSAQERRDDGATDGEPDPPPFYKPTLQPADYVGQPKGKKQILFERGLWKAGMVEKIDEDDPKGRDQSTSMDHVLGQCTDFRNETGALQTLVEARGHLLVMSPKGHCELAGVAPARAPL